MPADVRLEVGLIHAHGPADLHVRHGPHNGVGLGLGDAEAGGYVTGPEHHAAAALRAAKARAARCRSRSRHRQQRTECASRDRGQSRHDPWWKRLARDSVRVTGAPAQAIGYGVEATALLARTARRGRARLRPCAGDRPRRRLVSGALVSRVLRRTLQRPAIHSRRLSARCRARLAQALDSRFEASRRTRHVRRARFPAEGVDLRHVVPRRELKPLIPDREKPVAVEHDVEHQIVKRRVAPRVDDDRAR